MVAKETVAFFWTFISEARGFKRAWYAVLAVFLGLGSFVLCWRGLTTSSWTPVDLGTSGEQTATSNWKDLGPPPPVHQPELLVIPGHGFGRRFRTQACEHERQLPQSGRWDASAAGHDDREVMDLLELAQDPEEGRPRVACLVYSTWSKRQRLRDSFAVWGQDCDAFLPFSDETWTDNSSGFQTIEVHPPTGPDNYHTIIAKMRVIFSEITRRLEAGELVFDFLVVSGDDAFWILPSLRSYLRGFPTRGAGVYLGHRFAQNGNYQNIFASGAGYVINQVALRAYMECSLPNKMRGFAEDAVMGVCLFTAGIPVWPTEDAFGRQRFHFMGPAEMANLDYSDPPEGKGNWIRNFHRPWLPTMLSGLDGISKFSVLFHYVVDQRRYEMHDWLYRRIACKVNATESAAVALPPT